jgi:tripartite-type tricarboxylate transporter receptor subunit TctC
MKKLFLSLLMFCCSVHATEIVKVVVPFAPGGATASLALMWIDRLNTTLQKDDIKLVPDYKPGGGGQVGVNFVTRQSSDELVLLHTSSQIITTYAVASPSWIMHQDLVPLAYTGTSPMVLVTSKNSALSTVKSIVDRSRQQPVSLGHAGQLSGGWLAAISLQKGIGVDFNLIGYKGLAPVQIDVVGGHVDVMIDFISTTIQNINTGNLKPILVLTDNRLPELPQVPAYTELGRGTFPTPVWWGIYHNRTDKIKTLTKVQQAIATAQRDTEFVQSLNDAGFSIKKVDIKRYVDEQITYIKRLNITVN